MMCYILEIFLRVKVWNSKVDVGTNTPYLKEFFITQVEESSHMVTSPSLMIVIQLSLKNVKHINISPKASNYRVTEHSI